MNDNAKVIQNSEMIRDTTSNFLKGNDFKKFNEVFTRQTNIFNYTICSVDLSSESTFKIMLSYYKDGKLIYELWRTDMNTPNYIEMIGVMKRR